MEAILVSSVFNESNQQRFADIIRRTGSLYTFTHVEKGDYSPGTGTSAGDEPPVTYTAYAVKDSWSAYERNDSSIKIDDIKLIAEGGKPYAVDDTANIGGVTCKIMRVGPVEPGDVTMVCELQMRR